MTKFTAEEILIYLIELLLFYLEGLKEAEATDADQFCYGEKTAYVECLEIIQDWDKAEQHGLGFDIESKYPL